MSFCKRLDQLNAHHIAASTNPILSSVRVLSRHSISNAQRSAVARQKPTSSAKNRPGQTLGAPKVSAMIRNKMLTTEYSPSPVPKYYRGIWPVRWLWPQVSLRVVYFWGFPNSRVTQHKSIIITSSAPTAGHVFDLFFSPSVRENESTLWHPVFIVHLVDCRDMREVCRGSEKAKSV